LGLRFGMGLVEGVSLDIGFKGPGAGLSVTTGELEFTSAVSVVCKVEFVVGSSREERAVVTGGSLNIVKFMSS